MCPARSARSTASARDDASGFSEKPTCLPRSMCRLRQRVVCGERRRDEHRVDIVAFDQGGGIGVHVDVGMALGSGFAPLRAGIGDRGRRTPHVSANFAREVRSPVAMLMRPTLNHERSDPVATPRRTRPGP